MQTQNREMKQTRALTIAEGIGFAIVILGCVLGFWSNTQTRLTVLEMQMKSGDADRTRIELKIDKLGGKIDDVSDKVYEIKVITQGKSDKNK